MVTMRPLSSMTTPEPSRSRPRFSTVRPSGAMKVLIRTTEETRSSSEDFCWAEAGPPAGTANAAATSKLSQPETAAARMNAPIRRARDESAL